MHANLCMYILASTCQDGGNPFPVIRLPFVNNVTDSSRHTLLLPALHSQWSRQVYIIHHYVSHGNATITCYEETFRELGAVQLSTSANRKRLRYEKKPRTGASSIVACLVLTEFRRMF